MDSEENETSCSACREINSDPRRIACGHSFCLKCLQQVAGNNETFPCPICRFDVDLTQTNVDQLLKNVVFCNVIEARDTKQPSMCLDHNKLLDLFCQGCDAVICSKCLTMHHKGHAIEDIEIIFIERNKQLGAFLESTKHLVSMAQDKSDAVKQSRISMEKNIDSISKTVENTFKKWNDALQKQQNVIFSYLHQERDQKRQVFVEAERILAGSMTTVTGLDTEINKLRCKDTALVVQQYGSIKARQEDTERKVLQEIETCFTPSDNLVLEVYAPWIEEAINNIKHIDMRQTQARPGRQKIAEIQDENVILKRECEKFRNTLQELERETRRLQVENKYLKLILDDLHKSIIVGEATLQMELKPPEDIKNDKLLMELAANTRKINLKFYELETELNYIHRTISQLTSMIVGDDRSNDPTQEKTNKFTATGRQPKRNPAMKFEQREQSSKIDNDIELVTSVWRNLKEKEIDLSASKQEMANMIEDYEQNYEKLRAEHQNLKTAYTTLYERYNEANAKLSGFEKSMEEKTKEYQQKLEKEEKSKAEIVAKLRKTEQALNDKSVTDIKELADKNLGMGILMGALDEYVTSKKTNISLDIPKDIQSDPRFVLEHGQAKRIAQEFEKKERELSAYNQKMQEMANTITGYEQNYEKLWVEHQNLKTSYSTLYEGYNKANAEIRQLQSSINNLRKEKTDMYAQYQMKTENQTQEIAMLKRETETLLTRLSKIAGDRLTHDNVNIADLSNADRPTKLSEIYSELYDNEWTDAFEELTEKTSLSELAAIRFLLEILMNAFHRCKEITWDRYESLKLIASTLDFKQEYSPSKINTDSQEGTLESKDCSTLAVSAGLSIKDMCDNDTQTDEVSYDGTFGGIDCSLIAVSQGLSVKGKCDKYTETDEHTSEGTVEGKGSSLHAMSTVHHIKDNTNNNTQTDQTTIEETFQGNDCSSPAMSTGLSMKVLSEKDTQTEEGTVEGEESSLHAMSTVHHIKDNTNNNTQTDQTTIEETFQGNDCSSPAMSTGLSMKVVSEKDTQTEEPTLDGKDCSPDAMFKRLSINDKIDADTQTDENISKNVQTKTTSLSSTLSIDQEKSLKNIWRATSCSLQQESLKLLYAELSTSLRKYETELPKTYKYLTICTDLCWKMGVQEKPMHLDLIAEKEIGQEKQFDTDKFRAYTKTGKRVAYVVWPALFLHEGGAMLAKGIAQGCQKVLNV